MWKLVLFLSLMTLYILYSSVVYTKGTHCNVQLNSDEQALVDKGKILFQQYNCIACHQLYGLGGYLGPDLTTAYSDPTRGKMFIKTFLQVGGARMPNFHFTEEETEAIICFLKYVDSSAISYITK